MESAAVHLYPPWRTVSVDKSVGRGRVDSFLWTLNQPRELYLPSAFGIAFLKCWSLEGFIFIDQTLGCLGDNLRNK